MSSEIQLVRPGSSIIDRLHRNAVKQRLYRRFVRSQISSRKATLARTASVYFCIHYAGMSRKRAGEIFSISQERIRQIVNKGDKFLYLNSFQVCHPRGSCLIGAINK